MPRTLKQYYRALLVKLGMFDEAAFRLVIDRIYPDDTFIVSYPKSGNTWMRFLLANMLRPETEWNFRNIDTLVPDVYSAREEVNALAPPRFIKAHHAWFSYYPKTIYIVRDYRDVLVSYFHYQQSLKAWSGSFGEFIRQADRLHEFGSWKDHVQQALDHRDRHPEKILLLRYEDMLADPAKAVRETARFCGISLSLPAEAIAARCGFGELQQLEKEHGSAFRDRSDRLFFREGKSGGWKELFSAGDLRFIAEQHEQLFKKLNYL